MGFLTRKQINKIGFKNIGKNVLISDAAKFYSPWFISIGDNVRIDDFCILSAGKEGIEIGNYVHIACYVALIGKGKITLEDFSGISSRTIIYSSNDDYSGEFLTGPCVPAQYTNVSHAPVIIGKHVVVGSGCTILPGIRIEVGSAVGANSLVNRNVDAHIIVAGNPAVYIKDRTNGIYQLEKLVIENGK